MGLDGMIISWKNQSFRRKTPTQGHFVRKVKVTYVQMSTTYLSPGILGPNYKKKMHTKI